MITFFSCPLLCGLFLSGFFRQEEFPIIQKNGYPIHEIPVYQIGATIGVHTGPYPLGFGIIEKGIH